MEELRGGGQDDGRYSSVNIWTGDRQEIGGDGGGRGGIKTSAQPPNVNVLCLDLLVISILLIHIIQARDGTAVLWLVKTTGDVIGGLPDWSANDGPEARGPAKHRAAHHFVVAAQHITEILKQWQKFAKL